MSKLSFRARAIDANKPMQVFKNDEIPDLLDFTAVNRAVLEMPTGMEKEEETEHHLQRALSAQQVYGTAEALVIPVPDMDLVGERYLRLYAGSKNDFRPQKQYIHVQPFGMDQEIPEYDMDSEDEQWLGKQVKHLKMDVSPLKFESMMDRLEKGSGQMVVTLNEAKALLKVDDDLIIAVYDYWLNKRLRLQHALIPQVKTEKRDGSTTNNPYVAFRRRTEKMQTRKNRKNDEVSYEKMLKLKKDLKRALILLELLKRREKSKKELLKLTVEVAEKRYQMQDWEGKLLAEANAKKHTLPSFFPPIANPMTTYHTVRRDREWDTVNNKEPGIAPRKKREYKKRKHKPAVPTVQPTAAMPNVHLPNYIDVSSVMNRGMAPVSDDELSGGSQSDHESDNDPDGVFAFRRKAGCFYHSPRASSAQSRWPWCGRPADGMSVESCYRYSLAMLPASALGSPTLPRTAAQRPARCIGFVRRRLGRGGRVILDRGFTEWDDGLGEMEAGDTAATPDSITDDYLRHIRQNAIPLYRAKMVAGTSHHGLAAWKPSTPTVPFTDDVFRQHCEELLRRRQETQHRTSTGSSAVSESTSTLATTLDSASAAFAASAYCDVTTSGISVAPTPMGIPTAGPSVVIESSRTASVVSNSTASGISVTFASSHVDLCSLTNSSSLLTLSRTTPATAVAVDPRPTSATLLMNSGGGGGSIAASVGGPNRQLQFGDANNCFVDVTTTATRPVGNCVLGASAGSTTASLPNHSALAFRGVSTSSCQSAAAASGLTFAASTPLLKSSTASLHQMEAAVSRENRDATADITAVIMEVT